MATTYGASVAGVRALATTVTPNPVAGDPDFGASTTEISDAKVQSWIDLVADGVAVHVGLLAKHSSNTQRWTAITGAARTAITNGAASYLVSAAYPMKAGTNRSESYSAELWNRYEALLGVLAELPDVYAEEDAAPVVEVDGTLGVAPRISGWQSAIPSTLFYHQAPGDGSRAPGAESPYPWS